MTVIKMVKLSEGDPDTQYAENSCNMLAVQCKAASCYAGKKRPTAKAPAHTKATACSHTCTQSRLEQLL